jgi:uncharacterized coiled-coil protein SlyX
MDMADDRLTNLEILFTHLEEKVQALNEVTLQTVKRLDELERRLRSIADLQLLLEARLSEPRDPEAEKPPHY